MCQSLTVKISQNAALVVGRPAIERAEERPVDLLRRGAPAMLENILREDALRFYINGIVEQHQRLQRRVRIHAVHGAFLARGCIEGLKTRMQKGALPLRVNAAPVKIVSMTGGILALGKVQGGEVSVRLI